MSRHLFIINDQGLYEIKRPIRPDDIIQLASNILYERLSHRESLGSRDDIGCFLQLKLGNEELENFGVLFLDAKHRLITFQKLFSGTINSAVVYPRVLIKSALTFNAAAVILAHNHPSDDCEPSESDKRVTRQVKEALELIDIDVLDHFIVSRTGWISLGERGLL